MTTSLADFIENHRDDILRRCIRKAHASPPRDASRTSGIPAFLRQLVAELRRDSQTRNIRDVSGDHGRNLYFSGFTASEVVHDYGNVCQAVSDLAVEQGATIEASEFRTLNRCLDDAIASAVSSYTQQMRRTSAGRASELRTLLDSAITAFEALLAGQVGVAGTTGTLLHRSLLAIRSMLAPPTLSPTGA